MSEGCARQSFPKEARLRKRREYKKVYAHGRRFSHRRLVLFVLENELGTARLGVTATRRLGRATRRNQMKRYVREAFRRRRARLPGWDLVVNVRPSACPCAQRDVDHELASLLRRARRALAS